MRGATCVPAQKREVDATQAKRAGSDFVSGDQQRTPMTVARRIDSWGHSQKALQREPPVTNSLNDVFEWKQYSARFRQTEMKLQSLFVECPYE